jgi:subtilisin-like proprotein convertase family protein
MFDAAPDACIAFPESCNQLDDDCDGNTDEACPGTLRTCVSGDIWATLPSGVQIYAYEASRRDATSSSTGAQNSRACSVAGVQPWTNLTWDEASAACQAADPQGRLCTEEEWQSACQGGNDVGANSCTWSYSAYGAAGSAGCNTYSANVCNGLDFVPTGNPIEPTGWTGTPAMSSTCYRPYATGNLFDQSGNVKEYVDERLDDAIPVRGGAYNNTSVGISCGFDYTIWPNPDVAKFSNVGFRCCRGAAAARCVTVKASDALLPVVASNNESTEDLTVSLTVSLPGTISITDVNVMVKGIHGDFEDVRVITLKSPDNTTVALRNGSNDFTNGTDGFDLNYDDQATPVTLSSTAPIGGGIPTKPTNALSAFNGKDPEGTWSVTLEDNENDTGGGGNNDSSGGNWRIQSFQLKICGN